MTPMARQAADLTDGTTSSVAELIYRLSHKFCQYI